MRCVSISRLFVLLAIVVTPFSFEPEGPYVDTDCPDGWDRHSYDHVDKCYRVIDYHYKLEHCRISEWCLDAHPQAVPVRPRSEAEIDKIAESVGDSIKSWKNAVIIGVHPDCNGDRKEGSLLEFFVDNVNGQEPFDLPLNIGPYKSNSPEFVIGLGTSRKLEDLPEDFGDADPRVMCEIVPAMEANSGGICPAGFTNFEGDRSKCLSSYVYKGGQGGGASIDDDDSGQMTTCISVVYLFLMMFLLI